MQEWEIADKISKEWEIADKISREDKFLPKNRTATILPEFAPFEVQKDGKYGMRRMWRVNTAEFGFILVSDIQLCEIAQRFKMQTIPYGSGVQYP